VDYPVNPEISDSLFPLLRDIREFSECANLRLEGQEKVRIIGAKKQIENAQMLLETQLDYVNKRQQLRVHEREMREKLYSMEPSYGGGGRGGGGGMRTEGRRPRASDSKEDDNRYGEGEYLVGDVIHALNNTFKVF